MKEKDNFALVRKPSSAVEKAAPGAKRILSGMIADALVLTKRKPSTRIVVIDENPYPVELMERAIKKWFKTVVLHTFHNRNEGLQELSRQSPELLIVEIVNDNKYDFKTLQMLADKKVAYPIVVTSGLEQPRFAVNEFATQGLDITFLLKPFTAEPFFRILESKLKISRDFQ
jgi:DNA-binding NtrC family response regulator